MDFNLVVIYSMLLFGYVENILKANCVCNDLYARFLLNFTFPWILKYHAMFMLIFYSTEINVFRFASWWVLQTWEHRRVASMNETRNHQWESKRNTSTRMYKRQIQGEREWVRVDECEKKSVLNAFVFYSTIHLCTFSIQYVCGKHRKAILKRREPK